VKPTRGSSRSPTGGARHLRAMASLRQAHPVGHCGDVEYRSNAAYDVAVSMHPQERVLLRGIRVIREHAPKDGSGS
jgi:hypothetical protein